MIFFVTLVILFITALLFYSKWRHSYWSSRGVITPPVWPVIGHAHRVLSFGEKSWKYVNNFLEDNPDCLYSGHYEIFQPIFNIHDTDLIRAVLVKDFDHFVDRRPIELYDDKNVFKHMVFFAQGESWKSIRAIMTPTFSSGKIKNMFPLVKSKADELIEYCHKYSSDDRPLDMKKTFASYAVDVIARVSFGIDGHCLTDEDSEFQKKADALTHLSWKLILANIFYMICPTLARALNVRNTSSEIDYFYDVVEETINKRLDSENKFGDFLDLILEAEKSEIKDFEMNRSAVIAQALVFLLAGSTTVTDSLCFAAYALAKHKDKQEKLREELLEILEKEGGFSYQSIMEAKYLDACLNESMRVYPSSSVIERQCTQDYNVPDTSICLPKGMVISIPLWSIHRSEKYWDDPYDFVPERFLPENKSNINQFAFFPFGLGPRSCIGMRFAIMETKLALASLVLNFNLSLTPNSVDEKTESFLVHIRPANEWPLLLLKPV